MSLKRASLAESWRVSVSVGQLLENVWTNVIEEGLMGSCTTQTFTGITQECFTTLVQRAAEEGFAINGHEGQASGMGVTIRWSFIPATGALELQCLEAPFFAPCEMINGRFRELVESSRPSAAQTGSNPADAAGAG